MRVVPLAWSFHNTDLWPTDLTLLPERPITLTDLIMRVVPLAWSFHNTDLWPDWSDMIAWTSHNTDWPDHEGGAVGLHVLADHGPAGADGVTVLGGQPRHRVPVAVRPAALLHLQVGAAANSTTQSMKRTVLTETSNVRRHLKTDAEA